MSKLSYQNLKEIQADINYFIRQLTSHIVALENEIDDLKRENKELKKGGKEMLRDKHELAGKTVILNCKPDPDELNGKEFIIEDWWENVAGKSWMHCNGNVACIKYALRSGMASLPIDNEVVYGKIGAFGYLVHVSELGEVVKGEANGKLSN